MPVAAVVVDAALNGRTPSPADIAGTALVAAGVVLGAGRRDGGRSERRCPIHNPVQATLDGGPMT